jgi:hypothetical protein
MNTRRIISLTALLSFVIMLISSIVLFVVPQGRIAYWANWTLAGLDKEQWNAIHINTGFLFLAALGFHIYMNWRAIKTYLNTRSKEFRLFTKEFNVALAITATCVIGTYASIPPFSTLLDLSGTLKASAASTYGEPPYGHAELSTLAGFSEKMKLDVAQSIERLSSAGYAVTGPDQTLKAIATTHGVSPAQVVEIMAPHWAQTDKTFGSPAKGERSNSTAEGLGKLTLKQLCQRDSLDLDRVIQSLRDAQIKADSSTKLKVIAEKHGLTPHELYDTINTLAGPAA